jgi:ABC-type sugar transport system substrate-binding protein
MLEDWMPRFGIPIEDVIMFDARFDLDAHIGWYEDVMALTDKPDFIISHNVSAELMVPVAEKTVYEAGIPIFTFDCGIDTPAVTSFVAHKFEGPGGTDILGEWLIDDLQKRGFGPDNPVVVAELWGMRDMKTAQLRSEGFHKAVDRESWITVMESVDTDWAEEKTATITADMVMANPEIRALFHHGCGGAGMVPGLESIGMLLPLDDPDHIIIASNDTENAMWDAVKAGVGADTFSTHGAVEPTDIAFQVAIWSVIFGQPVEKFYKCPFIMITADNIDTVQIGGVPPSAGWPRDRWDLWVPMDPWDDYGFEQPSLEMRMKYQGY